MIYMCECVYVCACVFVLKCNYDNNGKVKVVLPYAMTVYR